MTENKPLVRVGESRGNDKTIIRFGRRLRADPEARYGIYCVDPDSRKAEQIDKGPIPSSGLLRPALEPMSYYLVVAIGKHYAGFVSTQDVLLRAPFYVTVDAPERPAAAQPRRKALSDAVRKGISK